MTLHLATQASSNILEEERVNKRRQVQLFISMRMRITEGHRKQSHIFLVPAVAIVRQRAGEGATSSLDELAAKAAIQECEELACILLHVWRPRVFPAHPPAHAPNVCHRFCGNVLTVAKAPDKLLQNAGLQILLLHCQVIRGCLPEFRNRSRGQTIEIRQ